MKIARLLPILAIALAACGQDNKKDTDAGPDAKPGLVATNGVLVLPAVKGNPGAAYFILHNGGDKTATLAAVSIDGAGKTEMHEMKDGAMAPIPSLEVKSGEAVTFERGGSHVMVFDLADSVTDGGAAEMTLTFADGDKVSAPLLVEPAGGAADHGDMH